LKTKALLPENRQNWRWTVEVGLIHPGEIQDYGKAEVQCWAEAGLIFKPDAVSPKGKEDAQENAQKGKGCLELAKSVEQTSNPTPSDMRAIRKVIFESFTEAGGQDRLAEIVEKHTCLQVVGPLGGAQAKLRLSETFGMLPGTMLELFDNNGKVIWSKKAHMPPFGALNDAVGCPR
jgi:hypothetical protein